MKLNKYFLIGAMGLGLFACSDELNENGNQDGNQPQEGTTYVALTLDFGNEARSRAGELPLDPKEDGDPTGNESTVKELRLIVIGAGDKIEYNTLYTGSEDNAENGTKALPSVSDGTATTTISLPSGGSKKFYAVVNEDAAPGENFTINSYLQTAVTKNASSFGVYNTDSNEGTPFVMSNEKEVILNVLDNISKDEAANKNPVTIDVERVLAKVTVQQKEGGMTLTGSNLTLTNLTSKIGNASLITDANKNEIETAGTYRMFKNENGKRTTPYYLTTFIENDTKFDLTKWMEGESGVTTSTNLNTTTNVARFYCLENTHDESQYTQGNTTFVRLTAQMYPTKTAEFKVAGNNDTKTVTLENNENPGLTEPATFYVIERVTGEGNTTFEKSYVTEAHLASLYGTGDDKLINSGATTDDSEGKAEAVRTELATKGYQLSEAYTDGTGYYIVWVNDFANPSAGTYPSTAPIFRNDWYQLILNSITLPGDPKGEIEPEKPIHPATHASVTVKLRKWNLVKHDVDLQ